MTPRRDPNFGRFAVTIITIGMIIIILGLAFIWFLFQSGGVNAPSSLLKGLLARRGSLSTNQALLYYTKDGKQLVGSVTDLGMASMSAADRARVIVAGLVEGRDAAFLKSPIPRGTRLNAVHVTGNMVIVNLSKEFLTNLAGGMSSEMLAVYSIVNSLLYNIENIEAVQILIEGERLPTLRGNVEIGTPLIANPSITIAS
ncbi:MAG: GerMN domain-containing protein [bacterium]